MTKDNLLTDKAKELSAKFHWHFDRSLKFRAMLDDGGLTARETARIAMKLCDEEVYCQEIDEAIGKILKQLRYA